MTEVGGMTFIFNMPFDGLVKSNALLPQNESQYTTLMVDSSL